jgi:hypothetical protein
VSRGFGELKILKHKESGFYRILLRQDRTFKVRVNHQVPYLGNLLAFKSSDKQFSWVAYDFAGGEEVREMFTVKFRSPEIAASFKEAYEAGKEANRVLIEKS